MQNDFFITEQQRQNAALGYGFLAPLLLLAKHRPEYQSTFVRNHLWNATKIHAIYGVILLIKLISFWVLIPFLHSFIWNTLLIIIALGFLIPLGIWLRSALRWDAIGSVNHSKSSFRLMSFSDKKHNEKLDDLDIIAGCLSMIPFLGLILPHLHPSEFSQKASNVSGCVFVLLLCAHLLDGTGILVGSLLTLLAFSGAFYTILSVSRKTPMWWNVVSSVPDASHIRTLIYATGSYTINLIIALLNKNIDPKPFSYYQSIAQKNITSRKQSYTQEVVPWHRILAIIPGINIVYMIWVHRYKQHQLRISIYESVIWTLCAVWNSLFIGASILFWILLFFFVWLATKVWFEKYDEHIPLLSDIREFLELLRKK